ncbi:MAG: hypothetical protein NC400_01590 [Clostridium sp.]|nr:hypothetical protein [Clostridium sp.]
MEKINDYILSPEAMVMVAGSSIGTQRKYYEDGYWYKQDRVGYEGIAEYLSSLVLACSNVEEYAAYEKCKINGRSGCRSANFLKSGEAYISLQRLYDTYTGGQLSERMRLIDAVGGRINYTVDYVKEKTGLDIREQLGKILTFDMLILNSDRHFNNIGIIADVASEKYRNAPIFDNGNALLSNIGEFPFDEPIESHIEKIIGQPFSVNLERQAWELGYGLKINYDKLYSLLDKEPETRALKVLQFQLKRYEEILKEHK